LQGKYARDTTTIINKNYKDQASKLEMENCPKADIHSLYTLYIYMSIFCSSRSNLVNKIVRPLKFLTSKSIHAHS